MSDISKTGFWAGEIASVHHVNSEPLSRWLVEYFKDCKDEPLYDFGCGMGYYADKLQKAGFKYVTGFEGDPPKGKFLANMVKQDLTIPFKVPVQGNCIFLEVAEHIPAEFEEAALTNVLGACKDKLVMSWAVRGQAGFGHVNCLDNHEVIAKIEAKGFKYIESDSEAARKIDLDTAPWFRHTILIFQKV